MRSRDRGKQAQCQAEREGEEGAEGERGGGIRVLKDREGEEGEEREERPLHLFIMMPVVVSVSCVGSRLYFMF